MKLQILIPHYNETAEEIKPMLDSIAVQQSIDFKEVGVILCHDGEDIADLPLPPYPFEIKQIRQAHKGVSATRNACLDAATADYVMFCDADDMFYSVCGLYIIFREIDNGGFDSLVSLFIEESRMPKQKTDITTAMPVSQHITSYPGSISTVLYNSTASGMEVMLHPKDDDEIVYINHEMDSTFVHGKVHRRQYLLDKKIRWNDNLTIHEDSFFNILCQNLSENVKYCPMPFYLWKWRDASVCRHDPKYILKTYKNMLDSNDALIDEFIKRGIQDKALFFTAFMIFDAYYTMNKPEWVNQENKEYRDNTELRFADYYKKHKTMWKSIPVNDKMMISNQVRQRSVMEGMLMEAVTIDQWLEHIEKLKGE